MNFNRMKMVSHSSCCQLWNCITNAIYYVIFIICWVEFWKYVKIVLYSKWKIYNFYFQKKKNMRSFNENWKLNRQFSFFINLKWILHNSYWKYILPYLLLCLWCRKESSIWNLMLNVLSLAFQSTLICFNRLNFPIHFAYQFTSLLRKLRTMILSMDVR